jgi:hypothetical protein
MLFYLCNLRGHLIEPGGALLATPRGAANDSTPKTSKAGRFAYVLQKHPKFFVSFATFCSTSSLPVLL